jgi:hypothetical protein
MAFRNWDTPYRPFRLHVQMRGTALVLGAGVATFYAIRAFGNSGSCFSVPSLRPVSLI